MLKVASIGGAEDCEDERGADGAGAGEDAMPEEPDSGAEEALSGGGPLADEGAAGEDGVGEGAGAEEAGAAVSAWLLGCGVLLSGADALLGGGEGEEEGVLPEGVALLGAALDRGAALD